MNEYLMTLLELVNHMLNKHPELAGNVEQLARQRQGKSAPPGAAFTLGRTLRALKERQIHIRSAVDVGANTGQWFSAFHEVFPDAEILSIEANADNMEVLRTVNPNSLNACLSARGGELKRFFLPDPNVTQINTGASLYKERMHYYENAKVIEITTQTLDSLNRTFDWIKLDVQGAELDVLQGGVQTLKSARFVQMEVSLLQYNEGAPLAAEVISYMHHQGFQVCDITEVLLLGEKINQLDLLFVAPGEMHLLNELQ